MMPACAVKTGVAWRRIPDDFRCAVKTARAAGGAPPGSPLRTPLDIADIGWAAAHRHWDAASNQNVSLCGVAGPSRIYAFTSRQGEITTPARQFFLAPPRSHPPGKQCRVLRPIKYRLRIDLESLERTDNRELAQLLGDMALAAADYEAAAARHAVFEALLHHRGATTGYGAQTCPVLPGIDCGGPLGEEGIARGAELLRGRGYGGSGLVLYEPMECERPCLLAGQYADSGAGHIGEAGCPSPTRAEATGIVRVRSRALDAPLDAGGPAVHMQASIMFDPYAAFAVRAVPRLWLELWLERNRQYLCMAATHTVCIDVNEDAASLLFHEAC